jgi:hypothetical protein
MIRFLSLLLVGGLLTSVGCGPAKVEIVESFDTNEEAFLVPLEADGNNQAHIGAGLAAFDKQRIETAQVSINQRSVNRGYLPGSFKWIPTQELVKVDTSPVTREWTQSPDTGTSSANQALEVESLESINIALPATITAVINRGDGAKVRYFFSGQKLSEIIDGEVHGFFQKEAARNFGKLTLAEFNAQMDTVGTTILTSAREYFAPRGISIESFAWKGGVIYTNPAIQEILDELFIAENDAQVAEAERATAVKANEILVSKAEAQRDAAITAFKAKEASLLKTQLEIRKIEAETTKAFVDNKQVKGSLPRVVPAGSGLLFGLDQVPTVKLPGTEQK